MPRPATVTALLKIVQEQSSVILRLTEALAARNSGFLPQLPSEGAFLARNTRVVPVSEAEEVFVPLPERVVRTIDAVPGVDDDMRAYLEELAATMLNEGMEEQLVVQMIAQGEQ